MQKVNEIQEALRNCAYSNSCNGCPFALALDNEDCKNNMMIVAADLIEQLDKSLTAHMQYNRNLRTVLSYKMNINREKRSCRVKKG